MIQPIAVTADGTDALTALWFSRYPLRPVHLELLEAQMFYNLGPGYQRAIERMSRCSYMAERAAPEWVDVGGEG